MGATAKFVDGCSIGASSSKAVHESNCREPRLISTQVSVGETRLAVLSVAVVREPRQRQRVSLTIAAPGRTSSSARVGGARRGRRHTSVRQIVEMKTGEAVLFRARPEDGRRRRRQGRAPATCAPASAVARRFPKPGAVVAETRAPTVPAAAGGKKTVLQQRTGSSPCTRKRLPTRSRALPAAPRSRFASSANAAGASLRNWRPRPSARRPGRR